MKTLLGAGVCVVLLSLAAASSTVRPTASAATIPLRPLETAIVDPAAFGGPDADAALQRLVDAGGSVVKVPMFWDTIAPATRPDDFQPSDPAEPGYYWTQLDTQIRLARARGLEPLVYIAARPAWALREHEGFLRPDPREYAAFSLAAVRRYSGANADLPRVRYWQAWNEPNKVGKREMKAGHASWYRSIVNGFAESVHTVPGNLVVAGGSSSFGISTAVAPLTFMRELLCMSAGRTPRPTCSTKVHFDIWATHPYTSGGPNREAFRRNDVSVGDLPEMKVLLDAAIRAGHVVSKRPVRFWVTEFSWDTSPPDPAGVPAKLAQRWVAEALYRMWSAGVSLVTWYTLRDQPPGESPYQSGLFYRGSSFATDRPKPSLAAFRFPFVAFPRSKQAYVWGRLPSATAENVVVEQRGSSGWRRVGVLEANRVGVFAAHVATSGRGPLRARVPATGAASPAFSLQSPPDRTFQPFGT